MMMMMMMMIAGAVKQTSHNAPQPEGTERLK